MCSIPEHRDVVTVALRKIPVWAQIAPSDVLRAQAKGSALVVDSNVLLLAKVASSLSLQPKEGTLPISSSPHLLSLLEMPVSVSRLS